MGGAERVTAETALLDGSEVVELGVPELLGQDAVSRFRASVVQAEADESVRVMVLRGSTRQFCRGMDLSEISEGSVGGDSPAWLRATEDFVESLVALRQSKAITVAVVEGPAMGGGVGLAAACDFVVATDAATFALPELLLGLVPAMILPVLAERFGLQTAKRWAMTQATWTATEAKTAGLVDQQVGVERLSVELRRLLRMLLRSHPRGVMALKRVAREVSVVPTVRGIAVGQGVLNELLGRVDVRRDLIAFRDFGFLPGEADA
jgi:enoyl-CoA hydratase/carnithine racemase